MNRKYIMSYKICRKGPILGPDRFTEGLLPGAYIKGYTEESHKL